MPRKPDDQKSSLINKAIREARKNFSGEKAKAAGNYVRLYYRHVPPPDIVNASPSELAAAALCHRAIADTRPAGEAVIRVYNPEKKKHGWSCDHTVVEIVNDDMPFLVDSVSAEIISHELTVHLVVHPILNVRRSKSGKLQKLTEGNDAEAIAESFIHMEISTVSGNRLDEIRNSIASVLEDVRSAVEDWRNMRDKMRAIIADIANKPTGLSVEEAADVRDFLNWVHDDQFTFLGFRDYTYSSTGGKISMTVVPGAGLGILQNPDKMVFHEIRDLADMPPEVGAFMKKDELLSVSKTNQKSTVHRRVHMDAIGIKRMDDKGKLAGFSLFIGLFTSQAYNKSASDIPLLSRRISNTVKRAGFPAHSHDGKALIHILENFPRDELFQVSEDYLYETSIGILQLQDRQRVALFLRTDDFERFVSCLIYVPRDRYTSDLRLRMQAILETTFAGTVAAHYSHLDDSPLARLHIIVQTTPGKIPRFKIKVLEAKLVEEARAWADRLNEALIASRGEEAGLSHFRRYREAFRSSYRERFSAEEATADIAKVEEALAEGEISMALYRDPEEGSHQVRFKIYHPHRPIHLSDILPMLEHLGLRVIDEIPFSIHPAGTGAELVMMHDFGLQTGDGSAIEPAAIRENFHETFLRVWRGDVESDSFNALVIRAGLPCREVCVLRAYSKYLRQAGASFSQTYMEQALNNNPEISRLIVDLFLTLFDPAKSKGSEKRAKVIRNALKGSLDMVASADEDRILRRFINLVDNTLRTNYFQQDERGNFKTYISFKLNSKEIEGLPLPRPFREIFVYSPRVEGIHLRFGKVARGGLRWSDRREDFRTEILGLVKAQQVKNAVIVPVGSKGGFVVKQPPAEGGREAMQKEGIACYQTLIRGLLDITDNLKLGKVAPPKNVVRRDEDDPYLVVAADKGTATFSDIANEISADYDFWLGDAFASGGSVGYDHKKMGITARGAWESVKRHFRDFGINIQAHDFTVVGVGDMSGDVFGNGMLLSPHIKLIAAFNHLHIFIDPDPKKSLAERNRLFEMPRSGWNDYNPALISKGGGVFDRSAKIIKLTPQIKKRFAIIRDEVTPNELIRYLLQSNADLMWLGGIGTYIKETDESNVDVGDRTNDDVRVNASDLRCRVIGEGANLGVTQRGRIEFALGGGRLYMDAIDNSAGVDCSDHEVNIKILLDQAVIAGKLTVKKRNSLLAKMTDEVADLVLWDNYSQTQAISLLKAYGHEDLDNQVRLMRMLERADLLNRAVEFLPDDETLEERAKAKLTLSSPEMAVLMSYAKIWLYDELIHSTISEDKFLNEDLIRYFPTPLQKDYKKEIASHRLRSEIIATRVTNSLINRVGGTFVNQMMEKTGMRPGDIARAYTITREVFQLRPLWTAIESLDNLVPAPTQTAMLIKINTLIERATIWFLRNGSRPLDIGANIAEFRDGVGALAAGLESFLPTHYRDDLHERAQIYKNDGVPEDLSLRIAGLVNLGAGCDVVRLASGRKRKVEDLARLYFAVGTRFRLGRLRAAAEKLEADGHWQQLALAAQIEEINGHQLALAAQVLDFCGKETDPDKAIALWTERNGPAIERTEGLLSELWGTEIDDLSMIAVASRQLRALADPPASS